MSASPPSVEGFDFEPPASPVSLSLKGSLITEKLAIPSSSSSPVSSKIKTKTITSEAFPFPKQPPQPSQPSPNAREPSVGSDSDVPGEEEIPRHSKNAFLPALHTLKPIKGGFLQKKTKTLKIWHRFLFVLEGQYLFYYNCDAVNGKQQTPKGMMSVQGCVAEEVMSKKQEQKKYCFSLRTKHTFDANGVRKSNERTYLLASVSSEMTADWIAILNTMSKTKQLPDNHFAF